MPWYFLVYSPKKKLTIKIFHTFGSYEFACKIYRDTRTSAHDRGVDLATNFGVVYQVKKPSIQSRSDADKLYAELKLNFDTERLQDGNVILVIDDIAEGAIIPVRSNNHALIAEAASHASSSEAKCRSDLIR